MNTTTTSTPPTDDYKCSCPCQHLHRSGQEEGNTSLTLEEKIEKIHESMKIDEKTTTKYNSRFFSAQDNRTLSRAIGGFGITVICCVVGGIAAMDMPHLLEAYRISEVVSQKIENFSSLRKIHYSDY
ncbi:hypothetical protein ScPMuIL_007092 [Solemya velum]